MDLEKEIQWYTDAVRSDLILHYGMTSENADLAMGKYMLKEKLKEYPEVQLHYGISATTREMRDLGYLNML